MNSSQILYGPSQPRPGQALQIRVPAQVASDDNHYEHYFDASAALESLEDQEIHALHGAGWKGADRLGSIAAFVANRAAEIDSPQIIPVITHCETVDISYTCTIDPDAGLKWVRRNRRSLYKRWVQSRRV